MLDPMLTSARIKASSHRTPLIIRKSQQPPSPPSPVSSVSCAAPDILVLDYNRIQVDSELATIECEKYYDILVSAQDILLSSVPAHVSFVHLADRQRPPSEASNNTRMVGLV